jgi:hypothetical protein
LLQLSQSQEGQGYTSRKNPQNQEPSIKSSRNFLSHPLSRLWTEWTRSREIRNYSILHPMISPIGNQNLSNLLITEHKYVRL